MLVQLHEEIIPRMPLSYVLGHSIITGFYGNKDSKKIFEKLSFFLAKKDTIQNFRNSTSEN